MVFRQPAPHERPSSKPSVESSWCRFTKPAHEDGPSSVAVWFFSGAVWFFSGARGFWYGRRGCADRHSPTVHSGSLLVPHVWPAEAGPHTSS
jgi:hypothetical protein